MRRPLRAALGVVLIALSVPAVLGPDRHVTVLAAVEVALALAYAVPRTSRSAGVGLLGVLAIAVAVHAARAELAGVPLAATVAILALWPEPPVQPRDPDDATALRTFLGRGGGDFSHLAHLRVARLYVQELALGDAIDRFAADLRRYTRRHGASSKYNTTITVAFLLLIRARLADGPPGESFAGFLVRNPDLRTVACLRAFYAEGTLASPTARRDFVFPDRVSA